MYKLCAAMTDPKKKSFSWLAFGTGFSGEVRGQFLVIVNSRSTVRYFLNHTLCQRPCYHGDINSLVLIGFFSTQKKMDHPNMAYTGGAVNPAAAMAAAMGFDNSAGAPADALALLSGAFPLNHLLLMSFSVCQIEKVCLQERNLKTVPAFTYDW